MSKYSKSRTQLSSWLKSLYPKYFSGKIPSRMNTLSKAFLTKFPNNLFFRSIEIKSFTEEPDKALDDCFPSNFFPSDNEDFISQIYSFLNINIQNFEKNEIIIKGIQAIIDNLKPDSLIKKYISLINIIAKNFDDENKILCDLLASNPFKYNELSLLVNNNLKLSLLPKTAVEFYSMSKYATNMDNFSKYSENDNLSKLREEFKQQINDQNEIINNLIAKVDKFEKESKETKKVLFHIQSRDVLKAFLEYFFWTIQEKNTLEDIDSVKNKLKEIAGNTNIGVEMIVNLLKNLKTLKGSGDDGGHYVNNIGFSEEILPEEVKKEYDKLKKKANCGIEGCDCIALLLSIKEVNDSSPQVTKKRYDLLKNLIEMPVKDWENSKVKIKKLLNSYNE